MFDMQDVYNDHQMLKEQNKDFQKRISILEHEVEMLKNAMGEQGTMKSKQCAADGIQKEDSVKPVCLTTPVKGVKMPISEKPQPLNIHLQKLYRWCTRKIKHKQNEYVWNYLDVFSHNLQSPLKYRI